MSWHWVACACWWWLHDLPIFWQCNGIKGFIVNLVIARSSTEEAYRNQKIFMSKLNVILVQIVKQEWPHNWPRCAFAFYAPSALLSRILAHTPSQKKPPLTCFPLTCHCFIMHTITFI